jgi:serine/threonine-protein kinase
VAIAVQHLNDPPPPISSLRPDVAPELEAAVMRALAKDPAARWADADEFIRALEGARAGLATKPLGQDTAAFAPVPAATVAGDGAAPPPEEERRLRWPWIALGLTALLIGLAVLLFAGGDKAEIENVVGQPEAVAVDRLQDDGFEVDVDRQPDLAPIGEVIHQDPGAGTEADEGSTVKLVVSTGAPEVTVPTVAGFAEKRAVRELSKAGCGTRDDTNLCGFKVEVRDEASDRFDEGDAIRTSPQGGTSAEVGSRVLLFVSTGPQQVEVPDVVDLERESAAATLNRAGLGFTIREEESDADPGTVIAQDPVGGTVVDKGSRVQLTVAKELETVEVPNVVGFSRATAEDTLRDAGLRPVVTEEETDDPAAVDQVLRQSPGSGADVAPRAEVEIVVGVASEDDEGVGVPPTGTGEGLLTE